MNVGRKSATNVRRKARIFRIVTSIVVPAALIGSFVFADRFGKTNEHTPQKRQSKNVLVAGVTAVRTIRAAVPTSIPLTSVQPADLGRIGRQDYQLGFAGNPPTSSLPSSSSPAPSSGPAPSLGPSPAPAEPWRAHSGRQFASGAILIRPTNIDVKPTRSRKLALRTGNQVALKRFGKRIVKLEPTIEFGEYDAPTGDWIGSDSQASGDIESRPVWVLHIAGIEPETDTTAVTDFVVIIDDKTGDVLVASEYLV